jgi:hypothetical protein
VLLVLAVVWVALMWWLRPFTAVEPALAAMNSDSTVTVTETATQIVMAPTGTASSLGVFFQPGAKVEARAYAAVLRPFAESGHTVVIPKQPLGIAFLSVGAFDSVRGTYADVDSWVVGGHSLGGTVAAIEVLNQTTYPDARPAATGLMFFASYPASDMSDLADVAVLSISGSLDGLSTPAKIDASRANLPPDSTFTQIEGAVHAQFGDYGPQPGDGVPTISNDDARDQISSEALFYLEMLASGPLP